MKKMTQRYRLYQRENGTFYVFDKSTKQRESLETKDKDQARRIVQAKNDAHEQPAFRVQLAKAYLAASSPELATRTWAQVFAAIIQMKKGPTKERWNRASEQPVLLGFKSLKLVETTPDHVFDVLKRGTVSTNVYLRRLHNFAVDMGWILAPILPNRHWPKIRHKEQRAITQEEHEKVLSAEQNIEWKAFYGLCWHIGGSQSDVAAICAENIQQISATVVYVRKKTGATVILRISKALGNLLATMPTKGPLFPTLANLHERHRASQFKRRLTQLGITGVTLHSYRYSWAERAATAGYPERFAQQALGHGSKAVHRAYARKAQFEIPALEDYKA